MKINPNKKPEQKFNKIKKKSIIFEAYIKYEDFLQRWLSNNKRFIRFTSIFILE